MVEDDAARCQKALRFIDQQLANGAEGGKTGFPPLWIDKCLYTPTLIVEAVVEAGRALVCQDSRGASGTTTEDRCESVVLLLDGEVLELDPKVFGYGPESDEVALGVEEL